MAIKLGCIACGENKCTVHGYVYYYVVVCLFDKTFEEGIQQFSTEMPLKEDISMFGYGQRFKTREEQEAFIKYLESNRFQNQKYLKME
jgi:hypothetical protein